ncbi:homocysteine S-methyltransferase family protein [Jannaschia sp. S6380]|uniref:homocysteine S-methyltransferase family protein n=1 Tax=Jannaschia sp. S6380 TaxID=2926408 RepID=UPI001FF5B01D|nr:homocysteine S-methyltransferase family protein [Jannaschia sp. S6380]MCK0168035.1 homocysteine S-methyltransferase family protein [Jannaschia sp. S6380]
MTEQILLTDGGLETSLIYRDCIALREFAAFELLETGAGRSALARYFRRYLDIATQAGRGFVLDTPTWRASRDWGAHLGYDAEAMTRINRDAVTFARILRRSSDCAPVLINGVIGPRGDGYVAEAVMTAEAAAAYHGQQVDALAAGGVDTLSAVTMTNASEATGILRAANAVGLPITVGFTTETDGRLPSGQTLSAAIAEVDAATDRPPERFMVNCAHPEHFADALEGAHATRIGAIRCNASRLSHAELDASETLDDGDPGDFARDAAELARRLPNLAVIGGCCGTDERHIARTAAALA